MKNISRILGGLSLIPSGGGKPEGKEVEQYSHVRDAHPVFTHEHDAHSEYLSHALLRFPRGVFYAGFGVKTGGEGAFAPSETRCDAKTLSRLTNAGVSFILYEK